MKITDESGNIVWEADYEPFGKAVFKGVRQIRNNFRLPGQYYDDETGLHYNMNRYYWPEAGRYITPAKFTLGPDDARILHGYDWEAFIKKEAKTSLFIRPTRISFKEIYTKEIMRSLLTLYGTINPNFTHLYVYVSNNPLIYTDETGEQGVVGGLAGWK